MPKVQVYVSADLKDRLTAKQVDTTKVCQEALEEAVADASSPRAKFLRLRKVVRELEGGLNAP